MARVITAPGIVRNVSKYLNSMRRVPFAIGKDDWTEVDSSTYTYEFVTTYVTTSSFDIVTFDHSVLSYAEGAPSFEKKNGGGGIAFTTKTRPTGTVSGSIFIWDNNDNKVPVILEDTVVPIENGGTNATSILGILSNLGLGSANDAQETLDFGDAVHEDVANNLTTTSEGYVLDARQGKVLKDSVDALNDNTVHTASSVKSSQAVSDGVNMLGLSVKNANDVTYFLRANASGNFGLEKNENGTWTLLYNLAKTSMLGDGNFRFYSNSANATTFTFTDLPGINASRYKFFLLIAGDPSSGGAYNVSICGLTTDGSMTKADIVSGGSSFAFTATVGIDSLTITYSQTRYGGVRLFWLG